MSFKKLDLDKDVTVGKYALLEKFRIGTSGALGTNVNFPNHFVTGGVSGSYYIDIYSHAKSDISANRLCSITYGHTTSSIYYSGSYNATYQEPKIKMYRSMAKRLLGNEKERFLIEGVELREAVFICIARNQFKDFVPPKGGASITLLYQAGLPFGVTYSDTYSSVATSFAGPVTNLRRSDQDGEIKGLLFANAGIFVFDPKAMVTGSLWSGTMDYEQLAKGVSGTTYNDLLWSLRYRMSYIGFNAASSVQSVFYKCTAEPSEFNYSSNPSFTSPAGDIITAISSSNPTSYITQVGLLGENQELIAVGKLQKPIRKNPHVGVTITVRIDH